MTVHCATPTLTLSLTFDLLRWKMAHRLLLHWKCGQGDLVLWQRNS